MSCPEPLPSRIPRQLRQRRVQADSVSPQLMDLVRPGPDARPDAGEERAENEEQDGSFPPHPGSPGNLSTHAQAAAQTGVRGMAQGNIPALSDRKTFFPVSQEPHDVCRERREQHGRQSRMLRNTRHAHSTYRTRGSPGERHMTVASARGCHHADERKCLRSSLRIRRLSVPGSGQGAGKEHSLR